MTDNVQRVWQRDEIRLLSCPTEIRQGQRAMRQGLNALGQLTVDWVVEQISDPHFMLFPDVIEFWRDMRNLCDEMEQGLLGAERSIEERARR
jgi:hypothetical protein